MKLYFFHKSGCENRVSIIYNSNKKCIILGNFSYDLIKKSLRFLCENNELNFSGSGLTEEESIVSLKECIEGAFLFMLTMYGFDAFVNSLKEKGFMEVEGRDIKMTIWERFLFLLLPLLNGKVFLKLNNRSKPQ